MNEPSSFSAAGLVDRQADGGGNRCNVWGSGASDGEDISAGGGAWIAVASATAATAARGEPGEGGAHEEQTDQRTPAASARWDSEENKQSEDSSCGALPIADVRTRQTCYRSSGGEGDGGGSCGCGRTKCDGCG